MARTGDVLTRIDLDLDPLEVAARCRGLPGFLFFDSAMEGSPSSKLSIIAALPEEEIAGNDSASWAALDAVLARCRVESPDDGLPRGFAAGWLGYDGAFRFGIYPRLLIYQHLNQTWFDVGGFAREIPEAEPATAPQVHLRFANTLERDDYVQLVRRAKEYIAAGDIYQVNLSHRFVADAAGDDWGFYERLRACSPAPFGFYGTLGETCVLSTSPELFLEISGRTVRTRPIKGTRPRRREASADERSAYDLLTSSKEVAELVMITDLERNDLGQFCEYGSVRVTDLLALERYAQVFHLVSTVEGVAREDVSAVGILRACSPGGSITGAPKKRAREIIAELEPMPRSLYTGAIGWFGFNGESRFSIAIRTVVRRGNRFDFHVGAGIVADSDPEREWEETLHKAAGILLATGADEPGGNSFGANSRVSTIAE